jgi:hypothetical protein
MKSKTSEKHHKPKYDPRKITYKGFGKKRTLHYLETATHLQSIVNYTLPNATQAGALLLNTSGKPDAPEYKLRFIWECQGIHNDFGEVEASSILNSIASLGHELPIGEKLRVEYQSFSDRTERLNELIALFENAPPQSQLLIAEEMKILQDLDIRGQRRPHRIFLMGTFTLNLEKKQQKLIEKAIAFGALWYQRLSGSVKEVRQQVIDEVLLKGYEQGFLEWQNLFRDRLQLKTVPLTGEGVWQHCWQELNRFNDRAEGLVPEPAPQLIEFNLQNGTIGEKIRTKLHPTSVMMRYPSAIPASNRDRVVVDRRHVGSLFLQSQPKVFEESDNKSYIQVELNFLASLMAKSSAHDFRIMLELSRPEEFGVRYNNQQLIRQNHYLKKHKEAKGQVDILADEELKDAIETERMLIRGDTNLEFALCIFVYRESVDEMHRAADEISSHFKSPSIMMLEVDTTDALWLSSLPFFGRSMLVDVRDRRDRERPEIVAAYFPLITTVNAHKSGIEFIANSNGSPIYLDPFKYQGHIALWGKTRSGKSLLAAYIIHLALALGIPVTILDQLPTKEASTFKDFTANLGGSYVDVFNDSINFFETPLISEDLDSETRDDMKKQNEEFILQILTCMVLGWKGEAPGVSSSKVISLLTTAIKKFFKDDRILIRYERAINGGIGSKAWGDYPTLSDFKKFCTIERINPPDATTEDINTLSVIQTQLQRWIDGAFGKAIDSPSTVKLDSPLITIAMRGVTNNDDAAVFGTIMYAAAMRRAIASAKDNGSLLFVDEASITFDLDPLSLCVGRMAANGLKARMRLMIAAQEPSSVYNSAGGKKIKDALSYHAIGRIGESISEYCDPKLLGVPAALALNNAKKDFEPDTATCSSQWLLKIDDRYTATRIYLPPSLVALTANNIDEVKERKARAAAAKALANGNGRTDKPILIPN